MQFAIIAAGEGSRLRNEGLDVPKPLIPILGKPMIERLVDVFWRNGAQTVSIIVNEEDKRTIDFLKSKSQYYPIDIMVKSTPSSMHSLFELSRVMKRDDFCVTTVDTIFRESEFSLFIDEFRSRSSDGLMGVSDFIDDEKPLYVGCDKDMNITGFFDDPHGCNYVSAGVYALPCLAFDILRDCINSGQARMRNFQRGLLKYGLNLKAFSLGQVIDVDHISDIEKAHSLLI